jgi:hypothetical protein
MASLPGGNSVIALAQSAEFAKKGGVIRRGANTAANAKRQPAPVSHLLA